MTKKIQFRAFIPPIMSAIRTGGDSMRLTFDVPESDLQDAVALIALRDTPLRITVEVDTSKTATHLQAEQTAKGPYGAYWTRMFAKGFQTFPDLQGALMELGFMEHGEDVKEALHECFGVSSLTFVSPDTFERWCSHNHLTNLITKSKNAAAEIVNAKAS